MPTPTKPSKTTTDAADATIAAELQNVDIDAAVAAATEPEKPKSAAKRGPLQLPSGVSATKVVLDFVTARASATPDAGKNERPFITSAGKVVIATPWLRAYLAETIDPKATAADAGAMLRDLGYKRRQVPMIGTKAAAPWVWTIDAPRSMSSIERQPAPEKPAKPAAAKPAAKSKSKSKSTSKPAAKKTTSA